ncbi:MAG: N-6 DNA methylase, partial [Chloroflexi bacterium]|nr:N-6 DNA methylase [Chloroflexota bacterium]
MTEDQRFEDAVRQFADAIAANFATRIPAQPEDQLKAPVRDLLEACGGIWGIEAASRTEVWAEGGIGRPDLGVTAGGLLCGHIELKAPGRGARADRFRGRDREQWERFKALPNLIYTDGSEWSLYRSGKRVGDRVRIADDVSDEGASGLRAAPVRKLAGLLRDFLMHEPVTPRTARGLAEFLAPLARLLRDEVREALDREDSAVRRIADEWRGVLFADAGSAQFADAYAQTVTYALLLAQFEGAENLRQAFAVDALRESQHDLLATALDLLENRPAREELSMPIDLLQRAIEAVDARVLLARRGRQGAFNPSQEVDRNPWLYFYEDFLGAYDAALRKNRGVYFTPVEVVRAQVRLVAELLRDRFGKSTGFAADGVAVLDPACGTGTYPLAVLQHAADEARERLGSGAVPERLRDLAGRLHAFEILVGPYAVAQLRLTQRLRELGVADSNPLVYLADTLESPNVPPNVPYSVLTGPLTRERERARAVKSQTRIFVCLGNPPYDREQRGPDAGGERRKGGWVRHGDAGLDADPPILEDFLAPVIEAGDGVHVHNLYNDYVYFWRWALWKVFDSTADAGIVTFITASSYLSGPAFAGMRAKMRELFDELWIIELEGASRGARKTYNVFQIQTPVAIAI